MDERLGSFRDMKNYRFWKQIKNQKQMIKKLFERSWLFVLTNLNKNKNNFTKKNEFSDRFGKTIVFFLTNRTIIFNKLVKNKRFLTFYWKTNFTEQTILLKEQFHWTKVQWENKQNR